MLVAVPLSPADAQRSTPEAISLGPATATSQATFTLIKGLRELGDGRLVITDWVEQRIVALDLDSGSMTEIGRRGSGPEEFRLPGELVAMPADSTLMIDAGNNRLSVIGPDLTIDRTFSMNAHGERWGMHPRAIDDQGVLYFALSPFTIGRGAPVDSVPIGRWHTGDSKYSLIPDVRVKASTPRPSTPSRQMNIPIVMFAKQDGWTVTSDGWLAVIRSEPYRVDWYGPEGDRVTSRTVEYVVHPVTMQDRRERVASFLAGSMLSGRGADGGMGLVPASAQSNDEVERLARDASFADEFPPFVAGQVWPDERGRIWVQRARPSRDSVMLDLFDRATGLVGTYTLGPGRQLVGVGSSAVYATIRDEDDLVRIERYAIRP